MPRPLLAAVLLSALPLGPGTAEAQPTPDVEHADSSLLAWVDAVARTLEARVASAGAGDAVRLELRGERGIDDRKARRVFGAHLEANLRVGGRVAVSGAAKLVARIDLSIEGSRIWAVGVVEGPEGLPGGLAVSALVDRELEAVLGLRSADAGQARWTKERLGTVPAGVLDLVLVDLDDDGGDDLVLLSIDGVRTLRFGRGDARPSPLGGPFALPGGDGAWPRVVAGWLALDDAGGLLGATTAGHRFRMDPRSGGALSVPAAGVPLRQPRDPGAPTVTADLHGLGPDLGPRLSPEDAEPLPEGLPEDGVRDLLRLPGRLPSWLWVDAAGRLGGAVAGRHGGFVAWAVDDERFGDRVLLADLDAGGEVELVTTSARPPSEPDQVTIHRLEPGTPPALSVLYRGGFGGAVRAAAVGDLDFDGRIDLVLVEEGSGAEAVVWRVERRR